MRQPKLMIHVQHLIGVGHLRRMLAVAGEAVAAGIDVRVFSGGMPLPGRPGGGRFEVVQLPPARAADLRYSGLVDARGQAVDDAWRDARRDQLLTEFERWRPDIVLIETWPFGRRMLEFELLPLLERAGALGCARACSVRDIMEPRSDPERIAQMAARAAKLDAVLVHGDPALLPFDACFGRGQPDVAPFANILRHTGYTATTVPSSPRDNTVLVSAGGGVHGGNLCRSAVRAAMQDSSRPWQLFTGQNLSAAEFEALCQGASPNLTIERHTTDFRSWLARCGVSVSQAGYNTAVELLAGRCPALLKPYDGENEREQTLRAQAFTAAGLAETTAGQNRLPGKPAARTPVSEHADTEADAQALLAGIARVRASGVPRPEAVERVNLDGLRGTVRCLRTLV